MPVRFSMVFDWRDFGLPEEDLGYGLRTAGDGLRARVTGSGLARLRGDGLAGYGVTGQVWMGSLVCMWSM